MTREELREKAAMLPLHPGVYLMKDVKQEIIYVGKSKQLRNRVSQYFASHAGHNLKTERMVSHVNDFDVILTATEFEALILENSLIKRHRPKYNILLKDDKGYPYIRFNLDAAYPALSVVSRPLEDGARYFGPYSGRRAAKEAIAALSETLGLPTCTRKFPRDIGKERPCLNRHLGKCVAPCNGEIDSVQFHKLCEEAVLLLEGKDISLSDRLEREMNEAAEALRFERAAQLRDRLAAVRRLGERQNVASGSMADADVIAFRAESGRGCIVMLHYIAGRLLDKETMLIDGFAAEDAGEEIGGFLTQYYGLRGRSPREILLSDTPEDLESLVRWLSELNGRKVRLYAPQRGSKRQLVELALENAASELARQDEKEKREGKVSSLLGELLGLSKAPEWIEAFDISNTAGKETVAGMVVFENGRPRRSAYRRFRIKTVEGQNDVGAMEEAVRRRFENLREDREKFSRRPDLVLVDGGKGQISAAARAMEETGAGDIPLLGMVKDDRHRTRALIGRDGRELGLLATPPVFALIGRIQEETHRYAISYHRALREKSRIDSALDGVPGLGEKRKRALLRHFGSIAEIRKADQEEIARIVPDSVAKSLKEYLSGEKTKNDDL